MMSVNAISRPPAVGTLEGTPRSARRWRLSLRSLMALVAACAFLLWGGMALRHYLSPGFNKAYYVGDLLPNRTDMSNVTVALKSTGAGEPQYHGPLPDMSSVIVPLKTTVPEDRWWRERRSVSPFYLSLNVIVRDSETGHAHVRAWLRQQRDRLKARTR